MTHNRRSSDTISLAHFQTELGRLVEQFDRNLSHCKSKNFDEASLRNEYLNPFFRALGWDVENKAGFIPQHREVEIESRTEIAGRKKRADYLFRTDRVDRFVCEAKKPAEELQAKYAYQAKRYAWNKGLVLAVLTDFEEMKIYVVGSKPHPEEVNVGLWKTWHFQQYPLVAREIWNLLSRPSVADGSIDKLIEQLPKKPTAKGKARQQWLFKPDRTRSLDVDFLNFLDEARRGLASDLLNHNDRNYLLESDRLNEATQRILDRLLFLRICEDRDIDTGHSLALILKSWQGQTDNPPKRKARQTELAVSEERTELHAKAKQALHYPLWRDVVAHFRALDNRPPSPNPYFNGNLFKPHFSEDLEVSDEWLPGFLEDVGDDESPYLFNVIPVEILGTIYERFLGKVVRPQGRGTTLEPKPEVRKAGGVYYTPRYIVDYIVEQTVGKLLEDTTPKDSLKLRILDPACGSGSFLIRAYERMCEHWQTAFMKDEKLRRNRDCWIDPVSKDIHLTTDLKRRILTANIYGVDIDPGAVEVTQLSLYLKMLEGENRTTMARERDLFGSNVAILPPLQDNIKNGNSLIASDFSLMPEDLVRVKAFDWPVQFSEIMKAGGFDAIIGNPPYRMLQPHNTEPNELNYLKKHYLNAEFKIELFHLFLQRGITLLKNEGLHGHIVPTTLLNNVYAENLRKWLMNRCSIISISVAKERVFEEADVHTQVIVFSNISDTKKREHNIIATTSCLDSSFALAPVYNTKIKQKWFSTLPGAVWNILINEKNAALIQKIISNCSSLDKLSIINRGLITGDRAKYFSTTKDSSKHQPILTGSDVYKYFTQEPKEYIKFERPSSAGGCWDANVHLAPHKIVIRQIGTEPTATLITKPIAVTGNIFTIRAKSLREEKYILAIINSKLIKYFWKIMFSDFKTSFPQVTIFSLSQVPIYKLDQNKNIGFKTQEKLIDLADKMLSLVPKLQSAKTDTEKTTLQNAITATDRQIDALVYELYGLTKKEIELIEKS